MAEQGDMTIVGSDSHFKGELVFEKQARINGRFDGKITGKGELQVSQNAQCKADLELSAAQIDGTVEGNVQARDTVRLNGSGTVKGDITAAKMVMSEGASFFGMCAVGADAQKQAANRQQNQPPQGGQPQGGQEGKK